MLKSVLSESSSKGRAELDAFVDRIVQFLVEGAPEIPRSEIRAAVSRWPRLWLRIAAADMNITGRLEMLEELELIGASFPTAGCVIVVLAWRDMIRRADSQIGGRGALTIGRKESHPLGAPYRRFETEGAARRLSSRLTSCTKLRVVSATLALATSAMAAVTRAATR